jgi:MFS family permease
MAPPNRSAGFAGPRADRSVLALLGIFFCSGLSMGYFSPLLSALMNDGGDSELAVGAVSAVFYACAAAGALWAGGRCLSIPRSLAFGLVTAGLLGAVAPFAPGVIGLAVARAGCGLAVGMYATVAQAALLARTTSRNRAFVTGVQALAFAAGLASGPFVATRIYERSPFAAFLAGGAVLMLAGFAVLVWMQPEWRGGESVATGAISGPRRGRLPLTAAFVYGFAESVLLSVYPLSLLERNLTIRDVGLSCSAFVFGGVLSVLPVSIAADRLGRARVLLACACCGLAALVGLSVVHGSGSVIALSFAVGASLGPMFAIGLALVRDQFAETDLARGTARFMTTFNIGCIAGPVISSIAMTRLGTATVFVPTLVLLALLVVQGSMSSHRSRRGFHVGHR